MQNIFRIVPNELVLYLLIGFIRRESILDSLEEVLEIPESPGSPLYHLYGIHPAFDDP